MTARSALLAAVVLSLAWPSSARPLESRDYFELRAVREVALSADGARVAYAVERNDVASGRPRKELWLAALPDGRSTRVTAEGDSGQDPVFSRDGKRLAYTGRSGERSGLFVYEVESGKSRFLVAIEASNSPLTNEGSTLAWSPDGTRIAYVSATPGPETAAASGDPVVITRYKYKPDYSEGLTRFSDNRRRHLFLIGVEGGPSRQLTPDSAFEEHSIDWSPDGTEILCVSNREPDPDLFYNPDLFAIRVQDGSLRRLTATESAEFNPRFSPDGKWIAFEGTRRGLTDLETEMEDRHVWLMKSDGTGRRELGAALDGRQGPPRFSGDGLSVYTTFQQRGSQKLMRLPVSGAAPEAVAGEDGRADAFDVSAGGTLAWAFSGRRDTAQLMVRTKGAPSARALTDLNAEALKGAELAPVESFTFVSNDFRFEVEAFLTLPLGRTAESKHPLIVTIHGGPHGQQGPAFDFKAQVYAAAGFASLKVNYRGSTGYGQKFTDAVFRDQNGDEAQDVLYGLFAALRRNPWIDRDRLGVEGGSYGGQLSCWLVTQTSLFKAAIPLAPITNNLSYNYTTYYNMYEQMAWGALPHQSGLMDQLWERSALKHVAQVKTPVMLVHGENDNDVPVTESEQFYVGLKDVGVEAVMVRYPREGHGLREPAHVVDLIDRSLDWYRRHFSSADR